MQLSLIQYPRTIRGLSLLQPWATLVAIGAKVLETRSRALSRYRGHLAIAASAAYPRECREIAMEEPFHSVLLAHGFDPENLPLGAILCTTTLTDIIPTEEVIARFEQAQSDGCVLTVGNLTCAEHELAFGNYAAGRVAMLLEGTRALREPIPVKGALGLYRLPLHLEEELLAT